MKSIERKEKKRKNNNKKQQKQKQIQTKENKLRNPFSKVKKDLNSNHRSLTVQLLPSFLVAYNG